MKNHWLKKNEERNVLCHGTRGEVPSVTAVFQEVLLFPSYNIYHSKYYNPISKELPQGSKVYDKQIYVCPLTGIKHNFKEGK